MFLCGRPASLLREKGFLGLAALGVVFFHRPLLFGETFFFRDLYLYFLPQKKLFYEILRSGELPLWNTYFHGGLPFFSDISNSPFYPSGLLYLLLPPHRALTLDLVLHVLAAAGSAYALARVIGLRQPAAVVAGLVYGYCGITLSQANLYFRLLAMPYLPLTLACWHLHLRRGGRRWLILAVASGTLQVFAGSPEMVVFSFVTLLGWTLFAGPRRSPRALLTAAGRWWLLGVAVAGAAAVQLVPLLEMAAQSSRGQGLPFESFSIWSLHPRRLPDVFVPGFLGRTDQLYRDAFWGHRLVDKELPYVLGLYFGAVPLALAALGGLRRRGPLPRALRLFLLGLAAAGAAMALGRFLPGFETLYETLPPLRLFRYPIKFVTLAVLPVALLAAIGAEALLAGGRALSRLRTGAWAVGLGLATLLAAGWLAHGISRAAQRFFFDEAHPRIAQGLAAALMQVTVVWLLATLVSWPPRRQPPWRPWALAAVLAADLLLAGHRLNPSTPTELIAGVPPAATKVLENLEGGRLYRAPTPPTPHLAAPSDDIVWFTRWSQEMLGSIVAATWNIPIIFHPDYNGLAPRRVIEQGWALDALPWERRLPLLSAAAVSVVMTDEDLELAALEPLAVLANAGGTPVRLYRNPAAARRIELAEFWLPVDSPEDVVPALLRPGFDPRRHAVVEGPVEARPEPDCAMREDLRVVAESNHRRELAVTTTCPAMLVLADACYPGWRAAVDGRSTPLLRANGAYSAVFLEPGEHRVVWRYVPWSLIAGALGSLLTASLLAASLRVGRRIVLR